MIKKSVLLRYAPADAFRLFTTRISEWWPPAHRPSKDPQSELFLEENGRFWERSRDGREIELGAVIAWDPPRRILLDFYIGTNAAQPTALEVTFTVEGDGTRVNIDHRPKPETGDLWDLRAPLFDRSWDSVLQSLVAG